jgi:hypothetical protein
MGCRCSLGGGLDGGCPVFPGGAGGAGPAHSFEAVREPEPCVRATCVPVIRIAHAPCTVCAWPWRVAGAPVCLLWGPKRRRRRACRGAAAAARLGHQTGPPAVTGLRLTFPIHQILVQQSAQAKMQLRTHQTGVRTAIRAAPARSTLKVRASADKKHERAESKLLSISPGLWPGDQGRVRALLCACNGRQPLNVHAWVHACLVTWRRALPAAQPACQCHRARLTRSTHPTARPQWP